MILREFLKQARKALGFNQEEAADAVGISRQYFCMIENGDRNPSVDVAKRIGETLKCDWTKFFEKM